MPGWLRQIVKALGPLIPREFAGQIEINVFKGGVTTVNVRQTFKDDDTRDDPQRV